MKRQFFTFLLFLCTLCFLFNFWSCTDRSDLNKVLPVYIYVRIYQFMPLWYWCLNPPHLMNTQQISFKLILGILGNTAILKKYPSFWFEVTPTAIMNVIEIIFTHSATSYRQVYVDEFVQNFLCCDMDMIIFDLHGGC